MSHISISTLEIRQERTSRFYLRVESTSAFKAFWFVSVSYCWFVYVVEPRLQRASLKNRTRGRWSAAPGATRHGRIGEPLNFKQFLVFPGVKGDKGDQGRPGKDGKQGDRGEKGRTSIADMMMLHVTKIYLNKPLHLLQTPLFPHNLRY